MNIEILVGVLGLSRPTGIVDVLVITVALALFGFWIWMLADCVKRIRRDGTHFGWLIFIVLTYDVGAIAYFFFGRRSQKATT